MLFFRAFLLLMSSICALNSFGAINLNWQVDAPSAHVPGQLLVKIDFDRSGETIAQIEREIDVKNVHSFSLIPGLRLYQFDPRRNVDDVIKSFVNKIGVIYAEPNFLYQAQNKTNATVNDPDFTRLWGLHNAGQTGGKIDADINADMAWDKQTGSKEIVIGIIDTGIDYTHPDLVDNVWVNQNEIKGNGIDDDNNRYVDDIHGINAIRNNGNPLDDNVHGTHVAGTIGAVGNNNLGVVGVNHAVQMVACKFLSAGGSGSTSDAIKCLEYMVGLKTRATNPVNIVATNNSWGGGGSSQAMLDGIKAHERHGILFIAAAGNESRDNDASDSFPANYDVANVISVAATDHNDRIASFSNYGKRKVHVAAPGVKILSTVLGHKYGELSGTSMAAPHVAGLTGLISAHYPDLDYLGIKNLIISAGTKIDALANKTISGRRIRAADSNGAGSLTCNDQTLVIRKSPVGTTHSLELGKSLFLSAQHINCANEGGALTVYQGTGGDVILDDNGLRGDVKAMDGIYSLNWQPTRAGEYTLRFSDADVVTVTVHEKTSFNPYIATDVAYEYFSMVGQPMNAGDDTMHEVKAPFPIQFGGNTNGYVDVFISSNGTLSFSDRKQPGFLNQRLPTSTTQTLVAPFWDDLTTVQTQSDIYIETQGNSPSRKFIIEWWRIKQFHASGLGAFQIIFYENSPNFRFNYLDTNFANVNYDYGSSATVGVQTSTDSALEYSFNSPNVGSGKSVLFTLQ